MASVIHSITANARLASMRWPATGRPAGVGRSSTTTSAAMASRSPQWTRIQPRSRTVGPGTRLAGACSAADMTVLQRSPIQGTESPGPAFHTLSKIKGIQLISGEEWIVPAWTGLRRHEFLVEEPLQPRDPMNVDLPPRQPARAAISDRGWRKPTSDIPRPRCHQESEGRGLPWYG